VVILLDVDFRRPSIHEFFNLTNDKGLVDLLTSDAAISDVLQFKKVAVLTTGGTPPNPTELLGSEQMGQVLSKLQQAADVVIIDGPPFLVADAMVVASRVDGVLLVVRPGHTRQSLALGASEQIKSARARMLGVVLNRIPLRGAEYYAGRSYAYTYYLSNYADGRDGDAKHANRGWSRGILLSPARRVIDFFKQLFRAVFKVSPK
jgi:succinoglycan biosynthesis transport protein ExoP